MCLQWAREIIFEGLFTSYLEIANRYVEDKESFEKMKASDLKDKQKSLQFVLPVSRSFDECVDWALLIFDKFYSQDPKQLLVTFPLDKLGKNKQKKI